MVTRLDTPIQQHCVHVAVYKWKPDAPLDAIEDAIDSLRGMADDVPGIRLITWGRNDSIYSEGFTHVILIVGDDAAAIAAYRTHPLHKPVADLLDKWEGVGIGVDFARDENNTQVSIA
jgi:hypothetical protein